MILETVHFELCTVYESQNVYLIVFLSIHSAIEENETEFSDFEFPNFDQINSIEMCGELLTCYYENCENLKFKKINHKIKFKSSNQIDTKFRFSVNLLNRFPINLPKIVRLLDIA